ncbi:dTDP-4-dehydrorhamnose reductase [Oscillospiraceae bacterium HV4-5-C5C]|nr:dTDP-4-dehydrorhamnose reductase [Oscillospiraceae bacterium HV4-5-C5C]
MNILITGSRGQLGTEIQKQLRLGYSELGELPAAFRKGEVTAIDLPELDITDLAAVNTYIKQLQPDVVINCAAFTNVDGCETQPDAAYAANAVGPRNLALACDRVGAKLVHVSTDYVFSGRPNGGVQLDESWLPQPISTYGRTKLLGEQYVRQFCRRSFIVRTAWLYSYYGKNFVKTILGAGHKYGQVTVVDDQLGTPTNAVDLAHVLLLLAEGEQYGLYHCTGQGVCSWYEFTKEIFSLAGLSAGVTACSTAEYQAAHPDSTSRPLWSALDNRMLRSVVGTDPVRSWQDALTAFFDHWDGSNSMKEEH